jgi:predicted transcriptional regulator
MANTNKQENERKTPELIKEKILETLNKKPLNAQEISKAINSNWSTVKNYIEELVKEKKVKEISFRNQVVYQKITGDTYFDIPIKEKDREMLKFIFSYSIEKYKELTGKTIRRTELAKLSAEINTELNLNLPIVWYIYGPMPLMIIDIQKDYSIDFVPKNSQELKKSINNWIKNNTRDLIRELRVEYYEKSKNNLYVLKEKIYYELEKREYNSISNLVFDFLTAVISYDKRFEEMVTEFYEIVSGANYTKLYNNPKFQNKILLAFDSLWKYIASNLLTDSLNKLGYLKEERELLLGPTIETKNQFANENIKELKELYLENLPEKISAPKFKEINEEARKVIDQWIDSEVWRE